MINPTEKDIGRGVVYHASYPDAPKEDGVITSYNDTCCFVRYSKQHPSQNGQATNRADLEWLSGGDTKHM